MVARHQQRRRARVACLAVPVVVGPQLIGGSMGWAAAAVAALAAAALIGAVALSRRLPRLSAIDALFAAPLLWTALQCVPLPRGVLAWTSPERLELRNVEGLVEGASGWVPLSLDPAQTWEELVVGAGLLAAYLLGRLIAARHGLRPVLQVAAASPLAVFLVACAHGLAGADAVFGWHQPNVSPALLSPLINPNHLGAFLGFGAHLGLALGLTEKEPPARTAYLAAACALGVGALLAVSRGATFSLALGLLWTGLVLWRERRRGRGLPRGSFRALASAAALIVTIGLYVGLDGLYADFEGGDLTKLALAGQATELALAFPWCGVGRGAFAAVFASVEGTTVRFTHPENLVLQWVTEWGIPFAVLLSFGLGKALWRAASSRRLELALGAGALGALVAHDLVDFALEMPGVLITAGAVFGGLVSATARASGRGRREVLPRWVALGLPLVAIVSLLGPGLEARRPETFIASLQERPLPAEELRRAVELHPLDAGIALWTGYAYAREGDRRALAWYNRAMALAPGWASPHLMAAHYLWGLGARGQAALELREALRRQPTSAFDQLCGYARGLDTEGALELVQTAAPRAEPQRTLTLEKAARCLRDDLVVAALDAQLLEERPEHEEAAIRTARRRAATDRDGATRQLRALVDRDPTARRARLELARLLLETSPEDSLEELRGLPPEPDTIRLRAEAHARRGNSEAMRSEAERLRGLAAGSSSDLADAWALLAELEESVDNQGAAIRALERAHRLQPREPRHLREIGRLSRRSGQLRRALRAYGDLCALGDEGGCTERDRLLERRPEARQRKAFEALAP